MLSPFEHLILELNNDDNIIANGPWRVAAINILKFLRQGFVQHFYQLEYITQAGHLNSRSQNKVHEEGLSVSLD